MNAEFRVRFPCTNRSAVEARRGLVAFICRYGFNAQTVDDIECAIGEALANAAEHGFRDGSTFDVYARVEGGHLVIDVQDDGPGFPHPESAVDVEPPPAGSPRGFGIFIMHSLMDEIAYSDRGRRIVLKKLLPSTLGTPGSLGATG